MSNTFAVTERHRCNSRDYRVSNVNPIAKNQKRYKLYRAMNIHDYIWFLLSHPHCKICFNEKLYYEKRNSTVRLR